MSIIDYINMASIGDMFYGAPKLVPNPNYRIPPTERVPPLREFNINGSTIKAKNRKEAIKIASHKGIIPDKKKK